MRDGGEDAALEMLRQPSATGECDDETPELNVEEPAPPRVPIPRRLCRAALACVPSVLLLPLRCCRAGAWTALGQGDDLDDAGAPKKKKKRSSRWKDGASQFEPYARRAPDRYAHDLARDDDLDGAVGNPLRSRAAAPASPPAGSPRGAGRAIGRARDDGSRRLCLNGTADVFVYEADEDKKGIASDGVKENRDDLRLLRKVAGKDWASLDAATIDAILKREKPPEPDDGGPPKRAFRWNAGPPIQR